MAKLFVFGIAMLVAIIILLSGCVQQENGKAGKTTAEIAEEKCIDLCETEKQKGTDLSAGPCLSNEVVEDWVCDVAHSPREEIDNIASNQCSAFGITAGHFVEVDEGCKFIRAV